MSCWNASTILWLQHLPNLVRLVTWFERVSYVIQSLNRVCLFVIPGTEAHQASLSFTISWSLLKLMSIDSVMPSNRLILCCPILLPSVFPRIRVFSKELTVHIRWPKYWSFSFSISFSMNIQGLFPLGWTGLISLLSKGLSKVFSKTTIWKHQFLFIFVTSFKTFETYLLIHKWKWKLISCVRPLQLHWL